METKLVLFGFLALAGLFVLAIANVLGAWVHHHTSRHDLIVESRRRRLNYLKSVEERQRREEEESIESIEIEPDEPVEHAQAA